MAEKIFRVNMSDMSTMVEEVPAAWLGHGGRGLTSTIIATEVEPTCHPLIQVKNTAAFFGVGSKIQTNPF